MVSLVLEVNSFIELAGNFDGYKQSLGQAISNYSKKMETAIGYPIDVNLIFVFFESDENKQIAVDIFNKLDSRLLKYKYSVLEKTDLIENHWIFYFLMMSEEGDKNTQRFYTDK